MIQVSKKWFIDSDGRQYILFKKVNYVNKDGEQKERQVECTYHPTISAALTCLLRRMQMKKVKQNDIVLKQAIDEFNKVEAILVKSVQGREI